MEEPAILADICAIANSVRAAPISFIRIHAVGPPIVAIKAMRTMTGAKEGPIAVIIDERRPAIHSVFSMPISSAALNAWRINTAAMMRILMIIKLDIIHIMGEFINSLTSILGNSFQYKYNLSENEICTGVWLSERGASFL